MSWLRRVLDLQVLWDLRWFDDHADCGADCARAAVELSVHG